MNIDVRKLATDIIDAAFISPPKGYRIKCENRKLMIELLALTISEHLRQVSALDQGGLPQSSTLANGTMP